MNNIYVNKSKGVNENKKTYLLGSKRGSGCSQAAKRAPEEPGAPLIKSFRNWRSLDWDLKI